MDKKIADKILGKEHAMTDPIRATRTELLCKDCRHSKIIHGWPNGNPVCAHPQALWQEPVFGRVEQSSCRDMRLSGPCGYGAALWMPKDAPVAE